VGVQGEEHSVTVCPRSLWGCTVQGRRGRARGGAFCDGVPAVSVGVHGAGAAWALDTVLCGCGDTHTRTHSHTQALHVRSLQPHPHCVQGFVGMAINSHRPLTCAACTLACTVCRALWAWLPTQAGWRRCAPPRPMTNFAFWRRRGAPCGLWWR